MSSTREISMFITGANGGLAIATLRHLIHDGVGHVTLAARTQEKADAAAKALAPLAEEHGTTLTAIGGFDMADPEGIRAAVARLGDQRFNVVFLQAGGVIFDADYQTVTAGGTSFERTIFQNVIGGHVTLAALLSRGLVTPGARIIAAGGEGARGIPKLIERPTFASPKALVDYVTVNRDAELPAFHTMNAIGVSKFLSALWVLELTERFGDAFEVLWFSPGLTGGTNGLAKAGAFRRFMAEKIGFPIMTLLGKAQTPEAGARKYADAIEGKVGGPGQVIGAPEGGALGALTDQLPMNPGFADVGLRKAFVALVEEAVGAVPVPAGGGARSMAS